MGGKELVKEIKELTDREVIDLCLNENIDYFNEILRRYKNLVFSIVLKMISTKDDVINDLCQEIFIKIYKNLSKYSDEFKFSTWVIRISTNHVIDYRRKKQLELVNIDNIAEVYNEYENPEYMYINTEKQDKIGSVIDSLPEIYKIPILMYHKEGLSYKEISQEIDEPLSKIKNRIYRGRKLLKQNILGIKESENNEL